MYFEILQVEKNIKMWYAYHQNMRRYKGEQIVDREDIFEYAKKLYWITILLDGTVGESKSLGFLDMSYDLRR